MQRFSLLVVMLVVATSFFYKSCKKKECWCDSKHILFLMSASLNSKCKCKHFQPKIIIWHFKCWFIINSYFQEEFFGELHMNYSINILKKQLNAHSHDFPSRRQNIKKVKKKKKIIMNPYMMCACTSAIKRKTETKKKMKEMANDEILCQNCHRPTYSARFK